MFKFTFCFLTAVASLPCSAAILTMLPTPLEQGAGMIHINIALKGPALSADAQAGTPVIQPLAAWKPGDTLDPASPWYATLDPSQAAGLFNSQFGLVLFESEFLPADSKIMVSWVSGTAGLKAFRWRNSAPQLFDPILGTEGSSTSWDWGTMGHQMMHPLFVMPAGSTGTASVTLAFTLTDSAGVALAGYTPAQTTVGFNVVPEPGAMLIAPLAGMFVFVRRRSHPVVS